MQSPLYRQLAILVQAYANCVAATNLEWQARHRETADKLVKKLMPSGGGIDSGTTLDWDKSSADKLVFQTAFHHMSEAGMYDGWTDHTVTVRASLSSGFTLAIGGRNRSDIKDYLADTFQQALMQIVDC